jgi:hypothetical protein
MVIHVRLKNMRKLKKILRKNLELYRMGWTKHKDGDTLEKNKPCIDAMIHHQRDKIVT